MIEAPLFIERSRERGFGLWTGVPCSFLTALIDCAIDHPAARWVASANEGDAVATAAGAALGGVRAVAIMQNSGLGNAVNPLASLTHTLRIPVLLIVTLRGEPGLRDEPQHELMGVITERMLADLRIPSEPFPTDPSQIEPALARACKYMDDESRPYAFVMRKGSVAPLRGGAARPPLTARGGMFRLVPPQAGPPQALPTREQALRRIVHATSDERSVVIATTGYTGRELAAIDDRPNQLYLVGSMGCASSLALGLALVREDARVVVVDGDGAALMRMGNFATLGAYGGDNLVHILLDNGVHDSTGGQPTVSSAISFGGIAAACGYGLALEGRDLGVLDELFSADSIRGPRFAAVKIQPGTEREPPRPKLSPEQVRARFAEHVRRIGGAAAARGSVP